jgi:hypothetical protein
MSGRLPSASLQQRCIAPRPALKRLRQDCPREAARLFPAISDDGARTGGHCLPHEKTSSTSKLHWRPCRKIEKPDGTGRHVPGLSGVETLSGEQGRAMDAHGGRRCPRDFPDKGGNIAATAVKEVA